jgi:hypothetical protein
MPGRPFFRSYRNAPAIRKGKSAILVCGFLIVPDPVASKVIWVT